MKKTDRGVSPVVSTILMVAIVIILAATTSVFFLDIVDKINEPAPNIADTTGEFEVAEGTAGSEQVVKITHIAGDGVPVEELEIVVRATGPSLDTTARLVDLPVDDTTIDEKNIEGNKKLIDKGLAVRTIQEDDPNVWSVGRTIEFRVATGQADFREGKTPAADKLEVQIVHNPSGAVVSKNTFSP